MNVESLVDLIHQEYIHLSKFNQKYTWLRLSTEQSHDNQLYLSYMLAVKGITIEWLDSKTLRIKNNEIKNEIKNVLKDGLS